MVIDSKLNSNFVSKAVLCLLISFIATGCASRSENENSSLGATDQIELPTRKNATKNMRQNIKQMELKSPAFEKGKALPARFACGGEAASPPLEVANIPHNAKSLAFIVEDPDAPGETYIHWLMWNWPANDLVIPAAIAPSKQRNNGAVQGIGSSGNLGYSPPCPPSGVHHYHFQVYALDTLLQLPASSGQVALTKAMDGHILAQGELVVEYHKP